MLFLRSFDIYIKNTIISSYILYMLLNSFNYFPLREINIFPHNNYSFDTHSFLESFHSCLLQWAEIVAYRRYRWFYQAHAACRMSRVACHVSHVARPIDVTSSIAPHATPIAQVNIYNYAITRSTPVNIIRLTFFDSLNLLESRCAILYYI